jgi:cytidylate kinase
MSEDQTPLAQMRAITISREYGSGGGEIARRVAQKLGWRLTDHEVVVNVAHSLGVSESEVAIHDEYSQSLVSRILSSMRAVDPAMMVGPADEYTPPHDDEYSQAFADVVKAAAQTGNTVIVGRASQVVLANARDVLHIRVVAPLDKRVAYVMQREGLSKEDAQTRVQDKDRQRGRYIQNVYHENNEDAHLYDLVINTGVLSLDNCVDLVCQALIDKQQRLNVPLNELGPGSGSGTSRYPGVPEDFRAQDGANVQTEKAQ